MRKFTRFLAGLFVMTALLGCRTLSNVFSTPVPASIPTAASTPGVPALELPSLSGDWQITLSKSGGIMGMSRTLVITRGGETTLTDSNSGQASRGSLSEAQQAALVELVAASRYFPASMPQSCADCFVFDLQISNEDVKFQVLLNDIDLPDSGLQPLVDYLTEYLK